MADDMKDGSGKKLILGLAIGTILVCLVAAAAILILSHSAITQSQELKLRFADNGTASDQQLEQTKSVVEGRFKMLDSSAWASTVRDKNGNAFVLVHYGDIAYDDAVTLATAPGVFEMRIQTQDNQSEHIMYGEDVKTASDPIQMPYPRGSTTWGVSIELTPTGAEKLQKACIDAGATKDSDSHPILMALDNRTFYSAPLSPDLAKMIDNKPAEMFIVTTGSENQGKVVAEQLVAFLRGGILPVRLEIVNTA